MLQAVGVSELEEVVYKQLLRNKKSSVAELSRTAQISPGRARKALDGLEVKGLVAKTAGTKRHYSAISPDIALEILLQSQQRELDRLRSRALEMLEQFRHDAVETNGHGEMVEVVTGRDSVLQRFKQIEGTARRELLMFNKPPYASLGLNELELEQLGAGVHYRVAYDRTALEIPGQLDWIAKQVAAGEEARVLSGIPMKIAIADRRLAVVPLYAESRNGGEPQIEEALIVHPGALLDALADNFETLWQRASSIRSLIGSNGVSAWSEEVLSEDDRRILLLLSAGLTDGSIGRQLTMGARTVQRRVRRILDVLGAETRFQAGLEAGKRGWL